MQVTEDDVGKACLVVVGPDIQDINKYGDKAAGIIVNMMYSGETSWITIYLFGSRTLTSVWQDKVIEIGKRVKLPK